MVKGFSKIYNLSFFGHLFLLTFVQYNWIFQKNFNFCKIAHFFVDYKIRAQELFNDVSFVIFGHQTFGQKNFTDFIKKYSKYFKIFKNQERERERETPPLLS